MELIGGAARRWRLALTIFLIVFGSATVVLELTPSRYDAITEILMYDPQQPADLIAKEDSPPRDFDTVAMNTQIQVFQSEELARRVIADLHLDQVPEFVRRPLLTRIRAAAEENWRLFVSCPLYELTRLGQASACGAMRRAGGDAAEQGGEIPGADAQGELIQPFFSHVAIARIPLTYVLSVSAWSSDATLAQALATTLVNDYLAGQGEAKKRVFTEQSAWLKAHLAELKVRIAANDEAIAALHSEDALQAPLTDSQIEPRIAQLNEQLATARADAAEKMARLGLVRQASASGDYVTSLSGDAQSSQEMGQLKTQRSILSQQEASLRARLGERHTQVAALRARIADIDQAISGEALHAISELEAGYDIALRRRQAIAEELQQLVQQRARSPSYNRTQELERTQSVDRKQYDAFLARYSEIEAIRSSDLTDKRVISLAGKPVSPYFPSAKLFLGAGAAAGLLLGGSAAVGLEFLRGSRRSKVRGGWLFGHAIIASVPPMRGKSPQTVDGNGTFVADKQKNARVIQAMRDVRTAMRMPTLERTPTIVMFTSTAGQAGVSTVSAFFAASCTDAGQNVVLIKPKFWHPETELQADAGPGLADLLADDIAVTAVISPDSDVNYDVIPPGRVTALTDDLQVSKRMAEVLRSLRARYDYVVIDAPPLDAGAGVVALAGMADKILVVLDAGQIGSGAAQVAVGALTPHCRRFVGIVLNRSDDVPLPLLDVQQVAAIGAEPSGTPSWRPPSAIRSPTFAEAGDDRA